MTEVVWQQQLDNYCKKQKANGLGENTIKVEREYLTYCLRFFNKYPLEITVEDIDSWKLEMQNREYEINTMFRSILTLRKFLRYLGSKIINEIKIPKRPKTVPPEKEIWLLPEEQAMMIKKSMEMSIRDYAIIKLFLSSGVRIGELVKIEIPDIKFDNNTILIRHGKGDKPRIVCFDEETKDAIIEYMKYRKTKTDTQALFISKFGEGIKYFGVARMVKECAILSGIKKPISPHKLRHTFITECINRTKDIPLAQKLAGHSDINTTMRYYHSSQEEVIAKYKNFYESASPKVIKQQVMSDEEILRAIDTKYIKGELPYEIYIKLRNEYNNHESNKKFKVKNMDISYI